jgi:hypothetical protein
MFQEELYQEHNYNGNGKRPKHTELVKSRMVFYQAYSLRHAAVKL